MMRLYGIALLVGSTLSAILPVNAGSTDPIRSIDIYVTPYYEAPLAPGDTPIVRVGRTYDAHLASNDPEDIVALRDVIAAQPELVTPMTLMVLAIRFYDVGLRDDAVFWFYAAKNRYLTMDGVLDMNSPELIGVKDAIHSFVDLAGPFINSYAFCDFDKQSAASMAALEWVRNNPYEAINMAQLPALAGGRAENLEKAIVRIEEAAQRERAYLSDPINREEMLEKRKANHAPEQFCWSS